MSILWFVLLLGIAGVLLGAAIGYGIGMSRRRKTAAAEKQSGCASGSCASCAGCAAQTAETDKPRETK